jgi:hypothetical protein
VLSHTDFWPFLKLRRDLKTEYYWKLKMTLIQRQRVPATWTLPPLHMAVLYGHLKLAEWLIAAGADIHLQDRSAPDHCFTPLFYTRHLEIIKSLIRASYYVNFQTNLGCTPLLEML